MPMGVAYKLSDDLFRAVMREPVPFAKTLAETGTEQTLPGKREPVSFTAGKGKPLK